MNHYLSVALFVAKLNPTKTFTKDGQNLRLDTLTCFGNGVLIDVLIWNQNVPQQVENRWILFEGFRLKFSGPDSMSLSSSVYSKMKPIFSPAETEQYQNTLTYKNLSCIYQSRNLNEINALSPLNEKLFSDTKASITDMKECGY